MKALILIFNKWLNGWPYHIFCLFRYLRFWDAAKVAICDFLPVEKTLDIRIGEFSLKIRSNYSDSKVALSSLGSREYEITSCENPKVYFDAGANIGTSSMYFASNFKNAQIIAIEPEISNFNLPVENTRRYKNITTINVGIWSENCEREIKNRSTGAWGYTIVEDACQPCATMHSIKCVTIDSLMDELNIDSVDILKIDIEGAEKEVLTDPSKWIDRVQIMIIELHDKILPGCELAFNKATANWRDRKKIAEKVIAYRDSIAA